LNYYQIEDSRATLPIFSPSLFFSNSRREDFCESRRDGHPEVKFFGFPKKKESVLVARSKATLEAGVRLNIVATARLVVEEMWTLSEMKVIQRAILSGKIEMQYMTEYLEDTRSISISLQQVDDQACHIRKHHQGLAFDRFKLGIGTQSRLLESEFPEFEVATTPKIKWYTGEERNPQCEPEPNILAPETPLEIICAYPAPILIRGLGKN
jgi:hypothetical protein